MWWGLSLIQVSSSLAVQWHTGLSHGVLAVPAWGDVGDPKRWFGAFFPQVILRKIIFLSVRTMASDFLLGKVVCQWEDRLSVGSAPGETLPCAVWWGTWCSSPVYCLPA